MKNRIKKRRLYAGRMTALSHTSAKRLKGMLRKRREPVPIETMHDVLARFDPERHGGEVWSKVAPIGQEFGARKMTAAVVADPDGRR
jgi:transposase